MALDLGFGAEDASSHSPSNRSESAMSGLSGFDDMEPFDDGDSASFWIEDDLGESASQGGDVDDEMAQGRRASKRFDSDQNDHFLSNLLGKRKKTLKSVAQSIRALSRASVRSRSSVFGALPGGAPPEDSEVGTESTDSPLRSRRETVTELSVDSLTPTQVRQLISEWINEEDAGFVNKERVKKIKTVLCLRPIYCSDFFTDFSSSIDSENPDAQGLVGTGLILLESLATFKGKSDSEDKVGQGYEILMAASSRPDVVERLSEDDVAPYGEAVLEFLKEHLPMPSFFALQFIAQLNTKLALPCCGYIIAHADCFPLKVTETALVTVAEEALDGNLTDPATWTTNTLSMIEIFTSTTLNDEILALGLDVLDWAILEGPSPFLLKNGLNKLHQCVRLASKENKIKNSTIARMIKLMNPTTLGMVTKKTVKRPPSSSAHDQTTILPPSLPSGGGQRSSDKIDERDSPLEQNLRSSVNFAASVDTDSSRDHGPETSPISQERSEGSISSLGMTNIYDEGTAILQSIDSVVLIEQCCCIALSRYAEEEDAPVMEEVCLALYALINMNPNALSNDTFATLARSAKTVAMQNAILLKEVIQTLLYAFKKRQDPGGGPSSEFGTVTSIGAIKEDVCGLLGASIHIVDVLCLGIRQFHGDLVLSQKMFRALYPCCATEPVRSYLIARGDKNEFFPSVLHGALEAETQELRTGCLALLMRVCRSHPAACRALLQCRPIATKPRLSAARLAEVGSPRQTEPRAFGDSTGSDPFTKDAELFNTTLRDSSPDSPLSPGTKTAGTRVVLPLLRRLVENAEKDTATLIMLLIRSVAKFMYTKTHEEELAKAAEAAGEEADFDASMQFDGTSSGSPKSQAQRKPVKMDKRETVNLLRCMQESAERFMSERTVIAICAVSIGHLVRTPMCRDVAINEIGTVDYALGLAKITAKLRSRGSLCPAAFEQAMGTNRATRNQSMSGMLSSPTRDLLTRPSEGSGRRGVRVSSTTFVEGPAGGEDDKSDIKSSGFLAAGFLLACMAHIGGDEVLTVISDESFGIAAVKAASAENKNLNVLSRDERAVCRHQGSLLAKKEREAKAADAAKGQQENIASMAANVEKAMDALQAKTQSHDVSLMEQQETHDRIDFCGWEVSIRELLSDSFHGALKQATQRIRESVERQRQVEASEHYVRTQVIESLEQDSRQTLTDSAHRIAMKQMAHHTDLLQATLRGLEASGLRSPFQGSIMSGAGPPGVFTPSQGGFVNTPHRGSLPLAGTVGSSPWSPIAPLGNGTFSGSEILINVPDLQTDNSDTFKTDSFPALAAAVLERYETSRRGVLEEFQQDERMTLLVVKRQVKDLVELLVAQDTQKKRRAQLWDDERQELEDDVKRYRSKYRELQQEIDEEREANRNENGKKGTNEEQTADPGKTPAALQAMMEMVTQTHQSVKLLQSRIDEGVMVRRTSTSASERNSGNLAPHPPPAAGTGAQQDQQQQQQQRTPSPNPGDDQPWAMPVVRPELGGPNLLQPQDQRPNPPAQSQGSRPSSAMARMRAGTPSSTVSRPNSSLGTGGKRGQGAKPQLERIKLRLTSLNNTLQFVDLSRSYLADVGLFYLVPAFRSPNVPHLTHLGLRQNGLSNTYIQHLLFGVLLEKPKFSTLDIAFNKEISPRAGKDFVLFAKEKRSLVVLDLGGTQVFNSTVAIINTILEERRQHLGIEARDTADNFHEDQRYVSALDV